MKIKAYKININACIQKMRNTNWHRNLDAAASLSPSSSSQTTSVPGHDYNGAWTYGIRSCAGECSTSSDGTSNTASNSKVPISIRHNDLDFTSESSSINSLNMMHRPLTNLPSITTTSEFRFACCIQK